MKHATLSLVLPVRDAAAHLATVVQDWVLMLPHYFADYEIIIVDDGSSDATPAIANELAMAHDAVMIMRHAAPQGYASALRRGLHYARGDYILSLPFDSGIGMGELVRVLPHLEEQDVILGYRIPAPQATPPAPGNGLIHWLTNQVLQVEVQDIGCRFMLLRPEVLEDMDLTASDALIHAEIYARASRQAARCLQVGILSDGTDQIASPEAPLGMVGDVAGLWWRLRNLPAPAPAVPAPPPRSLRQHQQKIALGMGLVAVASSVWLLLRRRVA